MNGSNNASAPGPLLVMGAGAIGCFLGGSLQLAGVAVTFVGRPRVLGELREHGLRLTDLDGHDRTLRPDELVLSGSVPLHARPSLVLLSVKSSATAQAAATLGTRVAAGTPVVSMQNGTANAVIAQQAASALRVLAGMVPFNVAHVGPGHFHRGTSGALAAQDDPALRSWVAAFATAGLVLELHSDLRGVQWAKLLLNLNNPVNALSGLPLRRQLLDRGFRICVAALQNEGLAALRAAGIEPARLTPLPPAWVPVVLRLPTPLFRRVASKMLRIDEQARSSMADDFARRRPTEIDALCGEVTRLARAHGATAPINERMVDLVQAWPANPKAYGSKELQRALGLA